MVQFVVIVRVSADRDTVRLVTGPFSSNTEAAAWAERNAAPWTWNIRRLLSPEGTFNG